MVRQDCKKTIKMYILNTQNITHDFEVKTISYHEIGCKPGDDTVGFIEYHCTTTLNDSKYYELIYDKSKKESKLFVYKLEDFVTITNNKI